MFPRIKAPKSHVLHNGHGILGHLERMDEQRFGGTLMPAVEHPVHLTPPHPGRLPTTRKRRMNVP